MRYRIIVSAAVALAATAASIGVAAVPASATGFKNIVVCDLETPVLCMTGYDGNGGAVKGDPYATGRAQDVDVTPLTNCGGKVTNSCPFPSELGLTALRGDSIVSITNRANGMTYRSDSQGLNVVEAMGGGDGQVWVQAFNLGGTNPGAFLINVFATNKLGAAEFACTSGSGGQLFLVQNIPSSDPSCQWQEEAGG